MTPGASVCKVTFHGNEQTRQHWFEARAHMLISETEARLLQLREGYDPALYGFQHFQSHKRGSHFIARWVCSSDAALG